MDRWRTARFPHRKGGIMPKLTRDQDFLAGMIFIIFGIGYLLLSNNLDFGSLRRMGPGFFPTILTVLLVAIGVFLALKAAKAQGEQATGFAAKAVLLISAATISFGVLIRGAGLLAAVVSLVLVSSLASKKTRPVAVVLLAAGLAVFSTFVFVEGLGLPMPVIGHWF
jgi:hypothetical protein